MTIREATSIDFPSIIDVLKESLGETSSKKNFEVWNFKHVDNPFGKSLVLVAEEDDKIIGVRAFMRWQWQIGENLFNAFRAVDTATHPQHQGKGIFKKLTLKALEIAGANGEHFVFNTPNSQSKPGYIKMGWEEVGRVETRIIPQSPFRLLIQRKSKIDYPKYDALKINNNLLQKENNDCISKEKIFTPKSVDYLKWRYVQNKIQKYFIDSGENHFVAVYLKSRGNVRELRVSECIFFGDKGRSEIRKFLNTISSEFKAHFISYQGSNKSLTSFQLRASLGPVLTFRNINCTNTEEQSFLNKDNWNYTLGDLELF